MIRKIIVLLNFLLILNSIGKLSCNENQQLVHVPTDESTDDSESSTEKRVVTKQISKVRVILLNY